MRRVNENVNEITNATTISLIKSRNKVKVIIKIRLKSITHYIQ